MVIYRNYNKVTFAATVIRIGLTKRIVVRFVCGMAGVASMVGVAAAQKPANKPAAETRILALSGLGGSVAIGDSLASAKKAFPIPKGAQEMKTAMNFAILQRPGWAWMEEKTNQAFEVNLKNGKVAGIAQTFGVVDAAIRARVVSEILRWLPKPVNMAVGKSASAYSWVSGANARFLVVMNGGMFGSGPIVMQVIGAKEELKLLNYRTDDVATLVKQLDLGSEAMKQNQKKPR